MDNPDRSKSFGHDGVKGQQKAPPQHKKPEAGQSSSHEKAVAVPSADQALGDGSKPTDDEENKEVKIALYQGNRDRLRSELKKRPDLASQNIGRDQDPPLNYILRYCKKPEAMQLQMIQDLVEYDYRPEPPSKSSRTPSERAEIVRAIGKTGRPALHCASYRNLQEVVKYLLKQGADINAVDNLGETALLHVVTKLDHPEPMALLLLQNKANPNSVAGMGTNSNQGRTVLHRAASRPRASSVVDLLLLREADVDPLDSWGETPLHNAASCDHSFAVQRLLDEGAKVDARSKKNWTPLHKAASHGHATTVKALLKFGASREAYTKDMETPESLAKKNKHMHVVEVLRDPELLEESFFGRSNKLSKLNANQKQLCNEFTGLLWPNNGNSDHPTLMKMLYAKKDDSKQDDANQDQAKQGEATQDDATQDQAKQGEPKKGEATQEPLVKELSKQHQATWIHLPANNRVWVEDVFKLIYHSQRDTTAESREDDNNKGKAPLQSSNSQNVLQNVLRFIDDQFNEISPVTHSRQPHFRSAQGPKPRPRKDLMMSMVLPVIDTDMQQPRFYNPEKATNSSTSGKDIDNANEENETGRRVEEYKISEGRPLNDSEKSHVTSMKGLDIAYQSIHATRTLDESFHEILDEEDLNQRNGDQVVSRYLARYRVKWEDEKARLAKSSPEKPHADHPSPKKGATSGPEQGPHSSGVNPEVHGSKESLRQDMAEENKNSNVPAADANAEGRLQGERQHKVPGNELTETFPPIAGDSGEQDAVTPLELEDQRKTAQKSGLWRSLASCLHLRNSSETDEKYEHVEDDDDSLFSFGYADTDDSEEEDENQDRTPRQQILVVPQFWLWKIEDVVVTTYPDKWDCSDSTNTLPQTILRNLERRAAMKKVRDLSNMNVHEILIEIIETVLKFEPLLSVQDGKRSYHDAFAGEIAYVSGQVAQSYKDYRKSLGSTADSFARGVQHETEYLVTVDDILSELAMIKRVEQDQDLVRPAIMEQMRIRDENHGTQENSASVTGDAAEDEQSLMPSLHSRPDSTYQSRDHAAKLDRQVEDALRVRHSIITLLDLRQRQASTENALNSSRQSEILFAQSKVIFIFTSATVIFAPLSWISSLMALNIDDFTPESWSQGEAFAAFFVSLIATLLLCLLGWRFNNKSGSNTGSISQSTAARSGDSTGPDGANKKPWLVERLTEAGVSWPSKRPHKMST